MAAPLALRERLNSRYSELVKLAAIVSGCHVPNCFCASNCKNVHKTEHGDSISIDGTVPCLRHCTCFCDGRGTF